MLHWFDGRVLCEEVKRYINNFMVVTRARPEEDVDNNSDDLVSDDELVVDQDNFADAVATRIGTGRDMPDSRCAGQVEASEDALELKVAPNEKSLDSALQSFERAQAYWPVQEQSGDMHKHKGCEITSERLEFAKAAARASQSRESVFQQKQSSTRTPGCHAKKNFTTQNAETFLLAMKRKMGTGC